MNQAELVREYLLDGHLIDRAGMPHVIGEFGVDVMRDVAISEWTGASPVYTKRIQRALGFEGDDDVGTIFKGMQFDIGAPHQFMDFRYRTHDHDHGEFWLDHCGALMDVEPMGEELVVNMCHHIEDPTFDATAIATNGRARMRPVHRPPRTPADRHPHCHWTVTIDPEADALPVPAEAERMAASKAAQVVIPHPVEAEPEGQRSYLGPVDPDLCLDRFSPATLAMLADEACLQGHLLSRSFMVELDRRYGAEVAERLGGQQLTGVGGVVADRLVRSLGLAGGGIAAVVELFDLHPAFRPGAYVDWHVEPVDGAVRLRLGECDALDEGDRLTWPALLAAGHDQALTAIARAIDPTARVELADDRTWAVTLDPTAQPTAEMSEVAVTRFSTGADWAFS